MGILGKLIVLTGLDGSGTSTVAEQLYAEDQGSTLLKSPPFPFSTNRSQIDEKVYDISPSAHYLYYLASNVYLTEIINKTMSEQDGNVYCIRYFIDTVVSHRAKGVNAAYEHETELYSIRKPDYIFYLDVEEQERQKRLDERGRGFLDNQLDDESLLNRFLEEFNALESQFIRIPTTNRDLEEIIQEIQSYIK
ncbi:AAA family ATPase [Lysinibacillus sp. BW-2-10]|nr:AAA family ATPase [Lysinibacillus sp. BW-2-10]